jgi:hypothetical protein
MIFVVCHKGSKALSRIGIEKKVKNDLLICKSGFRLIYEL